MNRSNRTWLAFIKKATLLMATVFIFLFQTEASALPSAGVQDVTNAMANGTTTVTLMSGFSFVNDSGYNYLGDATAGANGIYPNVGNNSFQQTTTYTVNADGSNLGTFDLTALYFTNYPICNTTFGWPYNFTITGYKAGGGTVTTTFSTTNADNMSFTSGNYASFTGITGFQVSYTGPYATLCGGSPAGYGDPSEITFDKFTIANPVAPVAAPTVTGITPNSGPTTGGTSVTIEGTNLTGATSVTIGGTAATSVTVVNDTTITATTPPGSAGITNVAVTTPGGTATGTGIFTYTAVAPTVTGISPNSGPTAGGTSVTITGTSFTGATSVTIGGAAATSVTVVNSTTITATTPAGTAGAANVAVTTSAGTGTGTGLFTYYAPPTVAGITPNAGPTAGGTFVTITGTNFTGATSVTIGGASATGVTVVSATTITATTPAGTAGAKNVAVTTPGGTGTGTGLFTYYAAPTVTGITPNSGPTAGGTSVTITGTNFTGATSVTIGGVAATSVIVVNSTTITAVTPAGTAGAKNVAVTTPGGTGTGTGLFTYIAPPTVTGISPNSGPTAGGTSVTITGTNFTGATSVTIGGAAATSVTVVNATTITATTPAGTAGAKNVAVTTPGGTGTGSGLFTYYALPTVTGISPSSGPTAGGTSVTITGTSFTGATSVTIGGVAATSVIVVNSTTITAVTPAGTAGAKNVAVTTPGGTGTGTGLFTYIAPPTVTGISPNSGPTAGGTSVTITGTNFTGATSVTIGGAAATGVSIVSATTITATTPAGSAGAANVAVTTPGGTGTGSGLFTYYALPTVTGVSPTSGPTPGGTSVTITGTNLTGATAVKFGTNAGSILSNTDTQIIANSPAGTGTVDITVTTAGGTSATSPADQFAYQPPTVSSVTPNTGPAAGGIPVTIAGTNLRDATAVRFGSNTAVISSNTDFEIVATSPAGSGTVDITVTTASGTSATSPADQFTYITVPGAPTGVSATAGDAQATVNFTAPSSDGGSAITTYTATSSPDNLTGSCAGPPACSITVTGLTNGTSYTFTVTATNAIGTGPASSASNSVTPKASQTITFNNPGAQNFGTSPTLTATSTSGLTVTFTSSTTDVCTITSDGTLTFVTAGTCSLDADQAGDSTYAAATTVTQSFTVNAVAPGAPTIGTATAGDAQATVAFSAPASNGGATITGYTVTSNPGGVTGTGASSPITVTGLTNGIAYTFTVTATNSAGTSPASAASNAVTPESVPTTTVTAAVLSDDTGASNTDWITNTASQTISGTLSANLASGESVQVSYDGGTAWSDAAIYSAGSSSWSTTTTLQGSNTFEARVTNAAGSSTSYTHAYTLDSTAPSVQAAAVVDATHVDVTFSEAVTNGATSANYTINNGAAVSAAADQGGNVYRLTTNVLSIGTIYTVTVDASQVKDPAGNLLSANTATYTRTPAQNSAPSTPSLSGPADASEVLVTTPTLSVNASTDPDGDPVTYAYEVYGDSGLTLPVTNMGGSGTSWTVGTTLADNTMYYWRAQATDGTASSGWMSTASLFVNTTNDAPTAPAISSPADSGVVSAATPTLTVTNATDVDRDILTYEFEVYANSDFTGLVTSAAGISQGGSGSTSWTVDSTLTEDTTYYWKSRARDAHNLAGPDTSGSFRVNTSNSAPTAPILSSPASGSETTSTTPVLSVNNSTDVDGDSLHYVFEIDTVNTFDSGSKQTSGLVAEGSGSTIWTPAALSDNTTYYWRVKANDGITDSGWMTTASLFVNTANDAPGVPTLLNPADGSDVTVLGPTLAVNAAADPDNDSLTYDLRVYSDSGLTSLVTSTTVAGTSWAVTPDLPDNTTYWWTARAVDEHGLAGDWMAGKSFFVNNNGTNDAPAITVTKPAASEPAATGSSFTITWTDSDPDSNASITLGYDTTGSGCTGSVIASGISEDDPADSSVWDISGLATGSYYVYAVIDDGTTSVCFYAPGPLIRMTRSGDVNKDGTVDVADALKALRIAAGLDTATSDEMVNGDVAPLVIGTPQPDGTIDIGDVVVILRKAVGLITW